MRTGNLEIIAGPCQYLPTMSYEQRSIAWTFFRQTFNLEEWCVYCIHILHWNRLKNRFFSENKRFRVPST